MQDKYFTVEVRMKKIIILLSTLYLGSFASITFANTPTSTNHLNASNSRTGSLQQIQKMGQKDKDELSQLSAQHFADRRGTYYYFSYPNEYYPDRYYYGNPYYYYYQPGVEFYEGPSRYYYRGK